MEIFNRIKSLNEASATQLVKTDKKLPDTYKKIFLDVKNLILEVDEVINEAEKEHIEAVKNRIGKKEKHIVVGGGCLSELFIENYEEKPKDMDIFVVTNNLMDNKNVEYFVEVANELLGEFELETMQRIEYGGYHHYYVITNIVKGTHKEHPEFPVEIIFAQEANLDYDLSIREFYSTGEEIYATKRALQSIQNKEIQINTIKTPMSTLLRAREFSERYGYKIEQSSREYVMKYLRIEMERDKNFLSGVLQNIRKYKDKEMITNVVEELREMPYPEEDREILALDEEKPGMPFREMVDRKEYAENCGWDLDQIWEVRIPKAKPIFSKYRHKETGEAISEKTHRKLIDIEQKYEKEKKMQRLFVKNVKEVDEINKRERKQMRELLKGEGYVYQGENTHLWAERYRDIVKDRVAFGISTANQNAQEKEMEKYLKAERIWVKISDYSKKSSGYSPNGAQYENTLSIAVKYLVDQEEKFEDYQSWTNVNAYEVNGEVQLRFEGDYLYMEDERVEQLRAYMRKGLKIIRGTEQFAYTHKEIKRKFGDNFKKYKQLTEQQKLKLQQMIEREASKV